MPFPGQSSTGFIKQFSSCAGKIVSFGGDRQEHLERKRVAQSAAEILARFQAEGRVLLKLAASAPHNNGGRFTTEDFDVREAARRAICPAAKESTQCSRLEKADGGKVSYRFEGSTHCADCALREQCVGKGGWACSGCQGKGRPLGKEKTEADREWI